MATQIIPADENTSASNISSEQDNSIEIKGGDSVGQSEPIPSSSSSEKNFKGDLEYQPLENNKTEFDFSDNEKDQKLPKIKIKTLCDKDWRVEDSVSKKEVNASDTSSFEEDEPLILRRKKEKQGCKERSDRNKKKRKYDIKKCHLKLHRLKVPDRVTHGALLKRNPSRKSQNPYIVKTWLRKAVRIKLVKEKDENLKSSLRKEEESNEKERKTVSGKLSSMKNLHDSLGDPNESASKKTETRKLSIKKEKGKC